MKILVVLSRFPYPLEKGDKLRAFYQLKGLAKEHEIILCAISDQKIKPEWIKEIKPFCSELHVFDLKKPLIYWNTAKQIFTGKPFQIGYFFQNHIQRRINELIEKSQPDHIFSQLVRTADYVKNHHQISKTIDYMDALGKGMFRRAEISTGIRKKLFQIEGKRLTEYENRIFDYFNHHTIISEQDRQFISHPQNQGIHIISNGIDSSFFEEKQKDQISHDLVFTGNMNYPPNVECACFIHDQILPHLPETTQLLLSGANPHERVLALDNHKNVKVTGWVDDIRDSYRKGKIFVAPLFIGTGLQNKLLEAMAMGLPVITTTLANNALKAKPDQEILIANSAREFTDKIQLLLTDSQRYQELSKNGQSFVKDQFSWESSIEELNKVFQQKAN